MKRSPSFTFSTGGGPSVADRVLADKVEMYQYTSSSFIAAEIGLDINAQLDEMKREVDRQMKAKREAEFVSSAVSYTMVDSHGITVNVGDNVLIWRASNDSLRACDLTLYQFKDIRQPFEDNLDPFGRRQAQFYSIDAVTGRKLLHQHDIFEDPAKKAESEKSLQIWWVDPAHIQHDNTYYRFADGAVTAYTVPRLVPEAIEKMILLYGGAV